MIYINILNNIQDRRVTTDMTIIGDYRRLRASNSNAEAP